MRPKLLVLSTVALFAVGCGGEDGATPEKGSAQIFVEAEDTIPNGLAAGMGEEDIQDGWSVTYDRFLITIGNFRASRSDASESLSAPDVYVLDLKKVPAGGYVVTTWSDASATRWDRFGFDLPNADANTKALEPTAEADRKLLADNGWSLYIEGSMTNGATTKTFRWGLPAGTSYDDCATEDEIPGFAVPAGGSVPVKPTIHGDHWFFNNITAGAEVTARYAQYIADADLDMDGETTLDELRQTKAADVFPPDKYSLAGVPIETAYDYVLAQARTLGDYQGEGECPTRKALP
ncbi:hypothetical protein [Polyangium spumosum]|uniref:Lipoprotein n=1 Tax=Polyangium spumosum TaxID=889282 RepID=A0A6N7PYD3_9BACT|nr:hypothetical protein [Polyangium spumosum]MRG95275.1 hypothetical protein [Polyangium spumosum]